jgi:hypothetical protein
MNQLTKLIEQWCGDDQDSARGFIELFNYDKKQAKSWTRFVEFLASRPTCGEEQRKFLDEIREKGEWASGHGAIWLDNGSEISQSDFETNLKELVNE